MNDVYDKTRMFAAVPHDVLDEVKNANAIALYTILKRYAGANGKAHPSRKKLAADMGFKSAMPVDKALEELRSAGLVQTFPRFKDESGKVSHQRDDDHRVQTSNGYIITDPHTSQMHTPTFQNVDPHTSQMYTPYIGDVHEVDTPEVDTPEVDPPVSPPEGDKPKKKPKPRRRLTDDWTPRPDVRRQLATECPGVDQDHELLQFRDYFIANDKTSTDWNLNYRRWIRTENKRARGRSNPPTKVENTPAAWGMSPEAAEAFGLDWGAPPQGGVVDAEIVDVTIEREIGA